MFSVMMRFVHILALVLPFLHLSGACAPLHAQDWERVADLRGQWKFMLGDDGAYSNARFDDAAWGRIFVPSSWEDEGYPGYDGFAWYRTTFTVPANMNYQPLYLRLGFIDDVDEVYVNGRMVGFRGSMPPHYITAYHEERVYPLPYEYVNFSGENVIAIRVYDQELSGGMLRGDAIGVYRSLRYTVPDQSLRGTWKLRAGDDARWSDARFDDSDWSGAFVPAYWETQGLYGYDGLGWYRTRFRLDPALRGQQLVLCLGRIDDADEVWLNGRRIGGTGRIRGRGGNYFGDDSYKLLRYYSVPEGLLRENGDNVIAVRVADGFLHGGMYEGPVGLYREQRIRRAMREQQAREERNPLERLLDAVFDR